MTLDNLKHAQRQRLLYLDRCFTWRGVARRRDLTDRFGISTAQAANDFRAYLSLITDKTPKYDTHLKAYVARHDHRPIAQASMADVFGVLDTVSDAEMPSELPQASRSLDPKVAAALYDAISKRRKIRVSYTSMTSGETAPQWVAPTRFTYDGERIYFRAYSYRRGAYRNFHPARIDPHDEFEVEDIDPPMPIDKEWYTRSVIWLQPSSKLSEAQAAVVRREYGFTDRFLTIETRQALEFFLNRRWGLNDENSRLEVLKRERFELAQ